MKKLLTILGSITLIGNASLFPVSCTNKASDKKINDNVPWELTTIKTIPTIAGIKAVLKEYDENINVDKFDVDVLLGMKSAVIRYLPNENNLDYLTKKINLEWTTNDLTKILTVTSLPYSLKDMRVYDENLVLASINLLNGTALTVKDVDVSVKPDEHSATIIAKEGRNFVGGVNIINENLTFDQLVKEPQLGTITINEKVYNDFKRSQVVKPIALAATVMEYVGDRNRAFAIYQKAFAMILLHAEFSCELFERNGTFSLTYNNNEIISPSSFKVNFKFIIGENKYYLNVNNEKVPSEFIPPVIKIEINYTLLPNDDFNFIRNKVISKTLGQEFINKYNDILDDEINIINSDYNAGIITLVPKAASRLFEISDKAARLMTNKTYYTVEAKFNVTSNS
ncbi:hypothetical protein S100390_v1c01350 [Spiroplasma sp. NBRC 100390]|uniref:lipoprotein n=1 Tax=unclassified Spiroplasma TaxID=2637901 RepID=UPI0008929EB9|nr:MULTISPECIES: lipoprotein [unclassified Spiroplasma]AOX43478.1 hypothetical protein STU14_v1c01350 [Spiroplasma sp. TU-14]APE12948.1 hypothetical protein S100390_v1c01350 [Spiroplasma sp. NBRC 100390]